MGKTQIQINGEGNNIVINSKEVSQESNIDKSSGLFKKRK